MSDKIKGTNEGSKVETLIENYLNSKIIKDLENSSLKKFILYICEDNKIEIKKDTTIKVKKFEKEDLKIKGSPKTDRVFFINNKELELV